MRSLGGAKLQDQSVDFSYNEDQRKTVATDNQEDDYGRMSVMGRTKISK